MLIKFTNCRLAVGGQLAAQDLWVDTALGAIVDPQKVFYDDLGKPGRIVDLGGRILAPGFIDIQINGALGVDFSVPSADYAKNLRVVNAELPKYGVTAYCPTLTSQAADVYKQTLPHLKPVRTRNSRDGAEILGAHVEGPFLSAQKKGIHSPAVFRDVADGGFAEIVACYGADNLKNVRIMTAAPELEGMMEVIEECKNRALTFSIGHTTAGIETAEEAVTRGATLLTHLFNAMPQIHHRDPGVIGLLGSEDRLRPYYGIICDGIHIHKSCVKLAYRSHPKGAILVTDAMALLGLPDGTYDWTNDTRITKEGDRLHLEGESTLAGSCVTLDACVRNLVRWTSCSLAQAVETVTANPAQVLGLKRKGGLRPGMDADLVVLDEQGNICQTWKFGEKVFDVEEPVKEQVFVSREEAKPTTWNNVPSLSLPSLDSKFEKLARVTSPSGVRVF